MWERRLAELLEFRRQQGHVNVPRNWTENPRLATWVANQRRLIGAGAMSDARLLRLRQSQVFWEGMDARRELQQATWDRMFASLRAFHRAHGHVNVPRRWSSEPTLAAWLSTQRFLARTGALAPERESSLGALASDWRRPAARRAAAKPASPRASRNESWEDSFLALRRQREIRGDVGTPADPKLAQWAAYQRWRRKQGLLSPDRIEKLNSLGFDWSGDARRAADRDRHWDRMFAALADYARRHGDSNVPIGWAQDRRLAAWVARQRTSRRDGTLRSDRVRRLESLKFDWNPARSSSSVRGKVWETMFEAVTEYLSRPGQKRSSDRALLRWIDGQRRLKHQGRLSPDRRQRLEKAGVTWSLREVKWESRFEQLCSYRKLHGDCRVPMGAGKHAGLARWISAQRADFLNGRLEKSKRSRLEEIGFVWRASTHRPEPAKTPAPRSDSARRAR